MIRVCGAGPGNPKYLTKDVLEVLETAERVIAFGRIAETLQLLRQDIVKIESITQVLDFIEDTEDVAILASGDPLFYGITDYLKRNDVVIDEIHPGISSVQYLMTRLQKPWQNAVLMSLHGREEDLLSLEKASLAIILTDRTHNADWISFKLKEAGMDRKMTVGIDLSYPEERIIEGRTGERFDIQTGLSVVVVEA